jgi:hypothetical protein
MRHAKRPVSSRGPAGQSGAGRAPPPYGWAADRLPRRAAAPTPVSSPCVALGPVAPQVARPTPRPWV